jgi:hypothetical protein
MVIGPGIAGGFLPGSRGPGGKGGKVAILLLGTGDRGVQGDQEDGKR